MKLLFDENLSPRLVELLATEFPQSVDVETLGMRGTTDAELWEFAKTHEFQLFPKTMTFDSGHLFMRPPKAIGYQSETLVPCHRELLRTRADRIKSFADNPNESMLVSKPSGEVVPNNMLHRIGEPFPEQSATASVLVALPQKRSGHTAPPLKRGR